MLVPLISVRPPPSLRRFDADPRRADDGQSIREIGDVVAAIFLLQGSDGDDALRGGRNGDADVDVLGAIAFVAGSRDDNGAFVEGLARFHDAHQGVEQPQIRAIGNKGIGCRLAR